MTSGRFRFERFLLDPHDRRLSRDDAPVELNARYLDALALLVREQGKLVSKERFHDEVWRGVPVTDEALTQCIRTLRRQLGDDAARPRFIETVPKHGYRFIAPVEQVAPGPEARPAGKIPPTRSWQLFFLLGGAGTIGGGIAGLFGGLFYGFAGAAQPLQPGMGAVSVLLVLRLPDHPGCADRGRRCRFGHRGGRLRSAPPVVLARGRRRRRRAWSWAP